MLKDSYNGKQIGVRRKTAAHFYGSKNVEKEQTKKDITDVEKALKA